jgi:chromosomal replication initiation ATPase DnaA
VLLASRQPAARWGVRLPDLASRLRAITAVEIRAPDDELLRSLLVRLIAAHQLPVTQPVHDWLLRRLPRTAGALREAMARLDSASLAAHRPITVPLARETLADMLAASDDEISGS